MTDLTDAKRRILDGLKRVGTATATELAQRFGITDTAARQHLESLETSGLVVRAISDRPSRGRPAALWRLSPSAAAQFPDRHGELTAELIGIIREALGNEALDRVVDERNHRQLDTYQRALDSSAPVAVRVRRLAELRSADGYMAEVTTVGDGVWELTEFHCPICDAASECQRFCSGELELFRESLGDNVHVERTQHLLSGDARCSYVVTALATTAAG